MKKLLNFKTMTMVLLTATTLTATAATTDGVKTNTTTKTSKKAIDYSKMNYQQLERAWFNTQAVLGDPKGNACARFKWEVAEVVGPQVETAHKKALKLSIECLRQIVPLEKEIINRLEKYSDNEEVYKMYKHLKKDISDFVKMSQIELDSQKEVLRKQKLKEQY